MERKEIGKIKHVSFGRGGYDDSMFGLDISLGNDSWGVGDFWGTWVHLIDDSKHDEHIKYWGEIVQRIAKLCEEAKVTSVERLKNIPVEVIFDGGKLKSWRILTEVI